jgi:hypothetical protein
MPRVMTEKPLRGRTITAYGVAAKESARRFPLPNAKPFEGETNLFEARREPLRFIYTEVGRYIVLLDVLEKRKRKLHSSTFKRLRSLRDAALKAYK